MTRMIERWFPCAEVSEASERGWGSGNSERNLFTWFAARPVAQAKAAVLTSLLPWPEEEEEQVRLQGLVRRAMTGRYAAWQAIRDEIIKHNGADVSVLDPFSGRGMIPLEAARLGIRSYGVDYSPVATVASELLTDYPFRTWRDEPPLLYRRENERLAPSEYRLLEDVEAVLREVERRVQKSMADFYPIGESEPPWGYLWAVALPCQECGRHFPLIGSNVLRRPSMKKGRRGAPGYADPGQSFSLSVDKESGRCGVIVHEGGPQEDPTLVNTSGRGRSRGKSAVCPFCSFVHPLPVHQRLASEGLGRDMLLLVGELDARVGKTFRAPTEQELQAVKYASAALHEESEFVGGLPAVPHEKIPLNNGATIRPQLYGARTYGDLMCNRQTLLMVRTCRAISTIGEELRRSGLSADYVKCLTGFAAATLVRQLRYSTRGSWLRARDKGTVEVAGIFVNEGTVAFSYDFFECGPFEGPGTWGSMCDGTLSTLRGLLPEHPGRPTSVERGSATQLALGRGRVTAVVTDPPYDAMVYYSDSSDLFYVWLKRALGAGRPDFTLTTDERGLQEKINEIIVKEHGKAPGEHRDRNHYDTNIAAAFAEMRRVISDDGLVTIVFGHGEPEVWKRLLGAISSAGLVMTGSWPARTESGGQQGKANIETTLTMSCRPAQHNRPVGRRAAVEAAVKREVRERMELWGRSGFAPTDMLMASAGPAMEVVGRYSKVLDARGEPVDIDVFLPVARQAVQEAESIEIDHHPLETFDARTRFALWWARLFERQLAPKSELRWQVLASSLDLTEVRDLVPDAPKGCQFVESKKFMRHIGPESSVIDVALAMAQRWPDGLDAVGEILADAGRDTDDAYLWAAISFLADRFPDSDSDAIAWTGILRNRKNVGNAARSVATAKEREREETHNNEAQGMFDFAGLNEDEEVNQW